MLYPFGKTMTIGCFTSPCSNMYIPNLPLFFRVHHFLLILFIVIAFLLLPPPFANGFCHILYIKSNSKWLGSESKTNRSTFDRCCPYIITIEFDIYNLSQNNHYCLTFNFKLDICYINRSN